VPRFQQAVGIRHFDLQVETALLQCQQRIVAFIGGAVQAVLDDDDAGEFSVRLQQNIQSLFKRSKS
jgi:hypothetical protein